MNEILHINMRGAVMKFRILCKFNNGTVVNTELVYTSNFVISPNSLFSQIISFAASVAAIISDLVVDVETITCQQLSHEIAPQA